MEIARQQPSVYLDLGAPSDRAKLAEPELYFSVQTDRLVILDEIQRVPELFQVLRGVIDEGRRAGRRCQFHLQQNAQDYIPKVSMR